MRIGGGNVDFSGSEINVINLKNISGLIFEGILQVESGKKIIMSGTADLTDSTLEILNAEKKF